MNWSFELDLCTDLTNTIHLLNMDLAGKRRQRGTSSASITKMKTKVEVWMNKENLTAIDFLAIQQAKGKLETLDAEFRGCHLAVVDELDNDKELEYKQAILDDHDDKVI